MVGKEGAELIAGVLNGFFDRMLGVAADWGGSCLKFGGDAVLLYFGGGDHAARAAACGLEMQEAMREFRRVEVSGMAYPLKMRIGIHSGRFFTASVGEPSSLLHYFITGQDVNRAAIIEAAGTPGRVVATPECSRLLGEKAGLSGASSGIYKVKSVDARRAPSRAARTDERGNGALSNYVPVMAATSRGSRQASVLTAEHRKVSIMFINVLGVSDLLEEEGEERALAELDAYMKTLIRMLGRHQGFLVGSDVAEEGDKIIAAFGAPVSHENQEASAIRCALDLNHDLSESGSRLRHRIGINTGFVFAGEIGGSARREYTVIGDHVNLAARLMGAAAPGQTMVSGQTLQRVEEAQTGRVRRLRVKGKSVPVRAAPLIGIGAAQGETEAQAIVGRDAELSTLLGVARRVARGRGRWVFVRGEPGIGKSALTAAIATKLSGEGWRTIAAYCQPHLSGTPFGAWLFVLRALFGVEPTDPPDAAAQTVISEVRRLCPDLEQFAPLVVELLGLPATKDRFLESLDVERRRQHLGRLVTGLVNAASFEERTLLLFEDIHWADEPSLELLDEVAARLTAPTLIAITSRTEVPAELSSSAPAASLALSALSNDDALQLARQAGDLSQAGLETVVAKSEGNPLFIQELARSGADDNGSPTDTINDVLMARLDTLPYEERALLRLASVVGPSFALRDVHALSPEPVTPSSLTRSVENLIAKVFLRRVSSRAPTLAFVHALAQDVAYETLPYSERRRLHARYANHLEEEHQGRVETVSELLLYHCERASDERRVAAYAAMSGERAAAVFANQQAVSYYERAMKASSDAGGNNVDRSLLLERMGECLEVAGKHADAVDAFDRSLESMTDGRARRPRIVPGRAQMRTRESDLCKKAAISCERASDYDEALRWLDRATAALPARPGRLGPQISAARSVALFRKGEYAEGVRWGRRAVELARRCRDREDLAYAHSMLALSYIEQGLLKEATLQLKPAIRLYGELDAVRGLAVANNNMGSCYQLLGDMNSAANHYRAALDAYDRLGDPVDSAIAHNNLGEVLLVLGRIDEAKEELGEVTRAYEAGADVAAVTGLALVNLSRCQLSRGDLSAADRQLRRGMHLLREVGAAGLLTEARIQLGELRLAQGNAKRAYWHGRRALERAQAREARILEVRASRLLASANAVLGRAETAIANAQHSLELARRLEADHEEAKSAMVLARLACGADSRLRSDAVRALRTAITFLKRTGAMSELSEAESAMKELARASA